MAATVYNLPENNISHGSVGWWNNVNGIFQTTGRHLGFIVLCQFNGVAQNSIAKPGYPVGLGVTGVTSPLIGPAHWETEGLIPEVGYVARGQRNKFLGILLDGAPIKNGFVRVLIQGFYVPWQHAGDHRAAVHLPLAQGGPVTHVDTGVDPIGHFISHPSSSGNTMEYIGF